MRITYCENYEELSIQAADRVTEALAENPGLLLCASTGHSPRGLYQEMGTRYRSEPRRFQRLRILKLDEWGGLPAQHPVTCEFYIRKHLLEPLHIPDSRYFTFGSNTDDLDGECQKVRSMLKEQGPIDLCILGLGKNGHLGLNEPAEVLQPHCHCAALSDDSLQHKMLDSLDDKPRYGITLGMEDILASKQILLLATGEGKQAVASRLLEQNPTPTLPASMLWTHGNTECLWDRSTLGAVDTD